MMEAITDLPPIVVSDLFGVHPHTGTPTTRSPGHTGLAPPTAGRSHRTLSGSCRRRSPTPQK
jgi:hypothetical protein